MTDPAIGLGQIQAADPDFDAATFLKHAGQSLLAVKAALQAREPADMPDLVSDSVYDDLCAGVISMYTRGTVDYYDTGRICRYCKTQMPAAQTAGGLDGRRHRPSRRERLALRAEREGLGRGSWGWDSVVFKPD